MKPCYCEACMIKLVTEDDQFLCHQDGCDISCGVCMAMEKAKLDSLVLELGEVYFIRKEADDEQKRYRDEFFEAATEEASEGSLARLVVQVPQDVTSEDEARTYAEQYYPGYLANEVTHKEGGGWSVSIEENPTLTTFEYAVEVDGGVKDAKGKSHPGYRIVRTSRAGSVVLDDERLREKDPDLWEAITTIDNYDLIADMLYHANVDHEDIHPLINSYDFPRVLKPIEDLDPKDVEKIKPYMHEGPRSVALNVYYAKEEEL